MVEYFCHVPDMFQLQNAMFHIFNLTTTICNLSQFHVCRLTRSLVENKISRVQLHLSPTVIFVVKLIQGDYIE